MENLDDLMGAEPSPVTLTDIVGTQLPTLTYPQSAITNRAATLALASDPQNAIQNFQMMTAEASQGKDDLAKHLEGTITKSQAETDWKTSMELLSRKDVPMETKSKIIQEMAKKPAHLTDTGIHNLNKGLSAPSKGEGKVEEDARLSLYDNSSIEDVYKTRAQIQGIVNSHAAGLRSTSAETAGEMAAMWVMPFGTNIAAGKLEYGESGSLWKAIKAAVLPGSSIMEKREKLKSLPISQRAEATRNILDNISKTSGIILKDNDFQEMQMAQALLEDGSYSNVDKWLDNLSGLLDIVGMGSLIKAPKQAMKLTKPVAEGAGSLPPSKAAVGASKTSPISEIVTSPNQKAFGSIVRMQYGEATDILAKNDKGEVIGRLTYMKGGGPIDVFVEEKYRRQGVGTALYKKLEELGGKLLPESSGVIISDSARKLRASLTSNAVGKAAVGAPMPSADLFDKPVRELNVRSLTGEEKLKEQKDLASGLPSRKTVLTDLISRIEANSVVGKTNPLSPHATVKLSNPESARASHATVLKAEDPVVEALTGTNKVDAIAADVYPQATTTSGRVFAQPVDIQREVRKASLPATIWDFMKNLGRLEITETEKAAIKANVVRDFQSASGLAIQPSMGGFTTSFTQKGAFIDISAIYSRTEGAWDNAQHAMDQAKLALRKYGVKDEDITLMRRDNLEYVPTTLAEEQGKAGNYMIRIGMSEEMGIHNFKDPTNPVKFDNVGTRFTIFERIPSSFKLQGSFGGHILDNASRFDPILTRAASNASDYAARMEKLMLDEASKYSDLYKKLPRESQSKIDEYLYEANKDGVPFSRNDLIRRGFYEEEIEAVKNWRDFWDMHYHLENHDLIRTLNGQGYELFKSGDSEFFVKPVRQKNQNISKVYDVSTGQVIHPSKQFMDELYDSGGHYSKLRRPTEIDGELFEYVISRNNTNEYSRKFRDSDRALNYREGYYTVRYDAPRFVDEVSIVNGEKVTRTIAVAKDSDEARVFKESMQANAKEGVTYIDRIDSNLLTKDRDEWFDLESARGRISQRHRGKLLEQANAPVNLSEGSHIVNPAASAIMAAKSISARAINRPMLETAKARAMENFKDVFPADGMGGIRWPSSVGEIGEKSGMFDKRVADARSNWTYVNYLENGYINSIDQAWKELFIAASEAVGKKKGLGKVQRGLLKTSEFTPSQDTKFTTYMASIVLNPLRQLVVQPHQAIRTLAYNPTGWATGAVPKYIHDFWDWTVYGKSGEQAVEGSFVRFARDSGMLDGVDKQNLIRGTLLDAAEASHPVVRGAKFAGEAVRKVGYDAGEKFNMLNHLAAVYDRYVRAGYDMTIPENMAKAHAEARSLSYEMNFAGDLPYNQTWASLAMQFAQVPHKALLQYSNKNLPGRIKAQLLAGDLLFWGPPAAFTYAVSNALGGDILPDDKDMRELITTGLENHGLNEALRWTLKDESINIDFTSLSPFGLDGWAKMIAAAYEGGPIKMLAESPAGQIWNPNSGRIPQAVKSTLRYFNVMDPVGQSPDDFAVMVQDVLKISGGFSNAQKAAMMLETHQRFDAMGRPKGNAQTSVEAMLQVFGFGEKSSLELYAASQKVAGVIKKDKEEVVATVKEILKYYQSAFGDGIRSPEQMQAVAQFMLKKYANNPEQMQIAEAEFMKALTDPNTQLMTNILKHSGIKSMVEIKDMIKSTSIPQEEKDKVFKHLDDVQQQLTILENKGK